MPAVIQCTQCQRQLNVLEAHLGALVRCPVCKTMFTAVAVGGSRASVPMPAPAAAPPLAPKTAPAIPAPPVAAYAPSAPPPVAAYAPSAPPPVASYAQSGPPPVASYAPPPGAPSAYAPPAPVASFAPGAATPSAPVDDQDPFWEGEPPPPPAPARGEVYHSEFDEDQGVAQRVLRRHRGPPVLGLGVAGLLFFCFFPAGWILGGIAVALGANDLQEMSRGRMDRAGRNQTQIGRWCGVAAAILATVVSFLCLLWLLTTMQVNS